MLTIELMFWTGILVVSGIQTVRTSVYKKVYRWYDVKKNWEGARKHCWEELGDLATIKSPEEAEDVKVSLDGAPGNDYWLGMWKRPSIENNYTWIDGPFLWRGLDDYANLRNELCVRLLIETSGIKWKNKNCTNNFRFICQFYQAVNICSTPEKTTKTQETPTAQGVSTTVGKPSDLSTVIPSPDKHRTTENKETTVSVSDNATLYGTKSSKILEIDLDDPHYEEEEEQAESDMKSSDYRTSAKAIGGTSIIFLVFFFGIIIVIDLDTFAKNLKQMKRNLSR